MTGFNNILISLAAVSVLVTALLTPTLAHAEPAPEYADSIVTVISPNEMASRSTALFLVGAEGWTETHQKRALRLSEMHTLIIGVDAAELMHRSSGVCHEFARSLSDLTREVQTYHNAYARAPVLVGFETNAVYALAAAWAAPENFKGVVTENAESAFGMCAPQDTTTHSKAPVRWINVAESETTTRTLSGATTVPPQDAPHKAFYQSYLRLAGTDSAFDLDTGADQSLQDLPLTVHHNLNAQASGVYAIFLSGDGGWAKFDEAISDRLAANGIPVVGISSLRYLWQEKTPQRIAHDLERIDHHFRTKFGNSDVMLLGFSLGANTIPFAATHVSEAFRDRLVGVGLIAPETQTGFEIVIGGWLGKRTGSIEVAPAIKTLSQRIPADRILCLHGRKETVSACPVADVPDMRRVEFEGGHHMGNDHDGVSHEITQLAVQSSKARAR